MEETIAIFIPIIFTLVTGLVIVTYIYFRSREKQMLIEKGLSAQDMKEFFERRKDPYTLLKIGIVAMMFGFGLGIGLMLEDVTGKEYYVVLSLFTVTGLGFIIANVVSRNLIKKESGV